MRQLEVLLFMLIGGTTWGTTLGQDAPAARRPAIIEEMGPKEIVYITADQVTIPCRASGIPTPTYKWTHDGKPLNLGSRHVKMSSDDGTLTFDPIMTLDEGYYQCIVKNQYGQDISDLTLLRRAVLGRIPPRAPTLYSGNEGQPLILQCADVRSYPPPEFSWSVGEDEHDAIGVALNERIQIDENGNLYFAYLTKADMRNGHIYFCNVYNSKLYFTARVSNSKIQVKPGSLVNKVPSLMYSTPSKVIALRGQNEVRFKCFFSGIPAPGVSWVRVGGALPAGRYALEASNTELVIKYVHETDQGMYQCTANNVEGTSSTKFTLDVQSKPEFVRGLRPTNINAPEKDQAEFNCKTEAEPPANVQWYINGEPVDNWNPGPCRAFSKDGTRFTISDLDGQSDEMVVQCNASNVHGYQFASGYLNVITL